MSTDLQKLTGVSSRFAAFVAERFPFALQDVVDTLESVAPQGIQPVAKLIEALRPLFTRELTRRLKGRPVPRIFRKRRLARRQPAGSNRRSTSSPTRATGSFAARRSRRR
jgi:hypothetical protein